MLVVIGAGLDVAPLDGGGRRGGGAIWLSNPLKSNFPLTARHNRENKNFNNTSSTRQGKAFPRVSCSGCWKERIH